MAVSSASIAFNSNPITAGYALTETITAVGDVPSGGRRIFYFFRDGTQIASYISNTASKAHTFNAQSAYNNIIFDGTVEDYVYDVDTGQYVRTKTVGTDNAIRLYVYWLPTLTATSPSAPSKGVGKTATFSSSISAQGNPSSGYIYKWQISTDGTNYSDISGATSLSYTTPVLTADDDGNKYRLKVTRSGVSGAKYSAAATLTITDEPILTAPTNLQVSVNPLTQDNITFSWTKSSDSTEILAQSALAYEVEATLASDTEFASPFYTFTTAADAATKTDNLRATILDPQSDTLLSGQYAYDAYKFRVRATVDYDYNGDETDETYTSIWTVLSSLTFDYRVVPSAPSLTLPEGDIYEGQEISLTWGRPSTYNAYDEDGTENLLTYYTKTASGLTLAKQWSGETEVLITGGVTSATVTEDVVVENVTSGDDLSTTVYVYVVDTENQTGANSASQNITVKRHRKPTISVASDLRAEGQTTLYVDVTDTGYGGSQSASQIYSFEYSIDAGANWEEILYADLTAWDGMRAEFDVTGLTDNVSTSILVRATNTTPNADTLRLTSTAITYITMPYTPIAYVYTSETENGFIAQKIRVGEDFSTGYEVYHENNLFSASTWIPAFTTGTPTYVAQSGDYVRFGNLCYVWGSLQWSTKTGISGAVVQVGGFPYKFKQNGAVSYLAALSTPFAAAGYIPLFYANAGQKYMDIYAYSNGANGLGNVAPATLAADGTFTFSFIYQVDAGE